MNVLIRGEVKKFINKLKCKYYLYIMKRAINSGKVSIEDLELSLVQNGYKKFMENKFKIIYRKQKQSFTIVLKT